MIAFTNEIIAKEVEAFTKAVLVMDDYATPLSLLLYEHFCQQMKQAVEHGRICTPERMVLLYPIFREINNESAENERYWREVEQKAARRKNSKANQLKAAKEVSDAAS